MPVNIDNEEETLLCFIQIYNYIKSVTKNNIILDFKKTKFVCGEIIVIIGVLYEIARTTDNTITMINISDKIKEILLSHDIFGNNTSMFSKNTAIHFKNFENDLLNNETDCFDTYAKDELLKNLSLGIDATDYIIKYLSEAFINARTHGGTNLICCCGQKYPNIQHVRFSIFDCGATIPCVVAPYINNRFHDNDAEYISWAVKMGNSTKPNSFGGLGLHDIEEFIKAYSGSLTIISRNGYYRNTKGTIRKRNMPSALFGTMIIIDIGYNTELLQLINKFKTNSKAVALEL